MQENSSQTMPETKNKTFVLVSAVLLLLIAAIIAVFFYKNQGNQETVSETEQGVEVQQQENQQQVEDMADFSAEEENVLIFSDLIARREGSYLCQISTEDEFYIYYIDKERLAMEIKLPEVHTKTIVDEDFTYTWSVDEKVGTKVSNQDDMLEEDLAEEELTVEEMMAEMPEEDLLPAEDVGPFDPADFVCEPWTVDESVFTPPSDVMFQDLSQLQEQMMDFVQ
jgi:hypothetical protein